MKPTIPSSRMLLSLAAITALGLTGCSQSSPEAASESNAVQGGGTTAELNEEAAAMVPQEIADAGVMQVATTIGMAPLNYPDEATGELVGFNIDIMKEIGAVLGLDVEMHGVTMDQIIPGIQAGRYDVTASNMAITEERQEVLDFVQYYFASSSLATAAGNPEGLAPDNLCGFSVGVSNGSFQQTEVMPGKTEACEEAGKAAIDVQSFPDQLKATLALTSGRLDAVAGDTPILLYAANLNDQLEVTEKITNGSIVAIGMENDSEMVEPIHAAMNQLIESGVYEETLAKYGISDLGIDTSEIKK